jgi:hypothetical protein
MALQPGPRRSSPPPGLETSLSLSAVDLQPSAYRAARRPLDLPPLGPQCLYLLPDIHAGHPPFYVLPSLLTQAEASTIFSGGQLYFTIYRSKGNTGSSQLNAPTANHEDPVCWKSFQDSTSESSPHFSQEVMAKRRRRLRLLRRSRRFVRNAGC